MIEQQLIQAIKGVLPDMVVYHDFAPEEAVAPFVILYRVGGSGSLYLDNGAKGYQIREQITVWAGSRLVAIDLSRKIEGALNRLDYISAIEAARALFDADVRLYGMTQDFYVIEQ